MDALLVNNFTILESVYGKFIVNRNCDYQADALVKTGRPHIDDELRKILAIVATLSDGCVAIDAGANIGLISIPLARALKDKGGVVYAFEAQRMLYYALCGGAAVNDIENLFGYHAALGAASGTLKVAKIDYGKRQDFGLVSLVDQPSDQSGESVTLRSIDEFGLARLDFLKIDVEGMEIDVLNGAAATIRDQLPWCWIEYWKVTVDAIKSRFAGLPYRFFVMDNLNVLCAPAEKLAASALTIQAQEA